MQHLANPDELLVIDVTGKPWAASGFGDQAADWLRQNL
jgi:hypothetical protein